MRLIFSFLLSSMVTACIVLLYISYAIPVVCLLIRGRNNIRHGPFWMGPIGLFANIVLLAWTAFTLIMYSFPSVKPVLPGSKFIHSLSVSPLPMELVLRGLRMGGIRPLMIGRSNC